MLLWVGRTHFFPEKSFADELLSFLMPVFGQGSRTTACKSSLIDDELKPDRQLT